MDKTKRDDHLRTMLWDGILSVRNVCEVKPCNYYPAEYHNLCHSQASIGWDQLLYGRFSHFWSERFQAASLSHDAALPTGGTQWISEVTVLIWNTILAVWKARCDDQHGRTAKEREHRERKKLRSQVAGIYATRPRLPFAASARLFPVSMEERMAQSVQQIRQWVFLSEPYAKAQLKVAKLQSRHRTRDIRSYFSNRSTDPPGFDNTTKRPP